MYEDTTVVLETLALHPFRGGGCDWYGTGGEAVVTFYTIKQQLWDLWSRQCVEIVHDHEEEHEDSEERVNCDRTERIVTPEKFDPSGLEEPGVYRDDTHYGEEGKVDEVYTIILPYDFLSERLCKSWIQKLNKEYNRDFVLLVESAFKQLWRENEVVRFDPEADTLYVYTRDLSEAGEVETEETQYHVRLKRDTRTGELAGVGIPNFNAVLEMVDEDVRNVYG